MSFQPNYKATLVILKDIEEKGLIQFNKEYLDEEFLRNFVRFRKAFSHTTSELVSKLDAFETKEEEITSFLIYSEMSYINSHLDVIKIFLKIIINPIKLEEGFGKNTTLQQMVERICDKMEYSQKLKESIRGLFLLDFADAISQQQFIIQNPGRLILHHNDKQKTNQLNIKDLADYATQAMDILSAMFDWSNGKIEKTENKSVVIDKIVDDLTNQVQKLDEKLDKLS